MMPQQGDRHVLADDGGRLEQALLLGRQAIDAGGQEGLHGGRHLEVSAAGTGESVGAALADQGARLHERADALLEEERIALGPLDQQVRRSGSSDGVGAEQGVEQLSAPAGEADRSAAACSASCFPSRGRIRAGS